jgi:hypothetical protein
MNLDAFCRPSAFILTPGNTADCVMAEECVSLIPGIKQLLADKGYDTDVIRAFLRKPFPGHGLVRQDRARVVAPGRAVLRILRLPLGFGEIGKAFSVAMSPDGSTVAAGGWTAGEGSSENIFLFDRASGELTQRLTDLPSVVLHLAYSPDGQRLAASLGGSNACST